MCWCREKKSLQLRTKEPVLWQVHVIVKVFVMDIDIVTLYLL